VGLAPADGTVRWEFPFRDLLNESSTTPILVDTRLIASSVTVGSVALTFAADAPKLTPKLDWKAPQLCCYFSTPVPVETHLYMVTGALALPPNKPKVNLQCVETATGKVVWTHGPIGTYHAALTRTANGQLLLLDDKGTLTLVAPDAAGFKSLATAKVCGNTWAHPALADNLFIVRDEKELIAVKLNE
jgi:outer membrane protein assembly factor BamB